MDTLPNLIQYGLNVVNGEANKIKKKKKKKMYIAVLKVGFGSLYSGIRISRLAVRFLFINK